MRIVFHLTLSAYCRKVRLVLAEKRLPFELRLEKVWERRTDYLDLNQAGTVPTLLEDNGLAIPGSNVICEYLEEAYPDTPLLGTTLAERVEVRRLVSWFDEKFNAEVTLKLNGEKYLKRIASTGHPDASALRAGYANLREHMFYLGWLAEGRKYLAGPNISLADFAAAAHLSVLDFTGDVDWSLSPHAHEWYARIKSRPSFRPLLADRVPGMIPPPHYANLDF
jgi:glutathione S-transferase